MIDCSFGRLQPISVKSKSTNKSKNRELTLSSLERIIPEAAVGLFDQRILDLHVERYLFAAKNSVPNKILDIACGVGYGSEIIINYLRKEVFLDCVDISDETIKYAREHYSHPRVRFIHEDANEYYDEDGYDTIISLETIEHLLSPSRFISNLVDMLKPDGILICSVPTTPSTDINPYHISDFTERSFRELFDDHLMIELASLRQVHKYSPLSFRSMNRSGRFRGLGRNLTKYYLTHPYSLLQRMFATFRYGFTNRYLTVAFRKQIS